MNVEGSIARTPDSASVSEHVLGVLECPRLARLIPRSDFPGVPVGSSVRAVTTEAACE